MEKLELSLIKQPPPSRDSKSRWHKEPRNLVVCSLCMLSCVMPQEEGFVYEETYQEKGNDPSFPPYSEENKIHLRQPSGCLVNDDTDGV